jgi:hypothetical protein
MATKHHNSQITESPAEKKQETCRHHWVIAAPDGPVSKGKCKICGEVKEFRNYLETSPWGVDSRTSDAKEALRVPVPDNDEPEE